jgi:hypothetical protein
MSFGEILHINLKEGMPTVEEARFRLKRALDKAHREGALALILIHGYGSTGVGGKIRVAIQASLRMRQREGVIRCYVAGENWRCGDPASEFILQECPELEDDPDLEQGNRGMSVVLM